MKKILIYDDKIGSVDYIEHMGSDLTVVNSARVSFGKQKDESSDEANNAAEQNMQSHLKAQYHRDIDQDVSSLESILDDSEDQLEEPVVLPAPDYDEPNVTVDDVLVESEMESFSEKNTVEHASVEDIGNHLESATVVGDVSSEVSFE